MSIFLKIVFVVTSIAAIANYAIWYVLRADIMVIGNKTVTPNTVTLILLGIALICYALIPYFDNNFK
jgi:uncharacterized membrane protein